MGSLQNRLSPLYRRLSELKDKANSCFSLKKPTIPRPDLTRTYALYDKLTGLDRVRIAHEEVSQAEKRFIQCQSDRRLSQVDVFRLEEARNRLNSQLDGVSRSDENFLKLVTELHEISRQHKQAREKLSNMELAEQASFEEFSGWLRRSQAEERVQANRMRQWSIGLSVVAGLVGFGATWLRYHQMSRFSEPVIMESSAHKQDFTQLDKNFRDMEQALSILRQQIDNVSQKLDGIQTEDLPSDQQATSWANILAVASTGITVCSLVLISLLVSR